MDLLGGDLVQLLRLDYVSYLSSDESFGFVFTAACHCLELVIDVLRSPKWLAHLNTKVSIKYCAVLCII